jgi:hypothetical protein
MRSRLFGVLAVLLLVALPTFAADRVIQNGTDLWRTPGNGKTFIDFSKNPIPAGFFCFNSAPFSGRIVFQGVPVATGDKKGLGRTDTIVQRLDDAVFNKNGVAVTRIQMRVLHFESVRPIKTSCGVFRVEVKLNGEQPVTRMRIVRENEDGGRFYAPIAVNGKLVFTPVGRAAREILEIPRNVRFPANQGIEWADHFNSPQASQRTGFVLVDTDNDRVPDTYLPGITASFAAGVSTRPGAENVSNVSGCHIVNDEGHCPEPV